jgi:hypothetical protein
MIWYTMKLNMLLVDMTWRDCSQKRDDILRHDDDDDEGLRGMLHVLLKLPRNKGLLFFLRYKNLSLE